MARTLYGTGAFPWDLAWNPAWSPSVDIPPPGGGINPRGPALYSPDEYDARVFRVPYRFYAQLIARVRSWRLSGSIHLHGYGQGPLDVTATAVDGDGAPLTSPWCKHSGWYGESGDQDGWTNDPSGDPIEVGSAALALWTGYHLGYYEDGELVIDGNVTSSPAGLNFLGVDFGSGEIDDVCPVEVILPATSGGSFDGTGLTGVTLKLAGPYSGPPEAPTHNHVTGSFTLTPVLWWDYADADGPIYDTGTGGWLRDPAI